MFIVKVTGGNDGVEVERDSEATVPHVVQKSRPRVRSLWRLGVLHDVQVVILGEFFYALIFVIKMFENKFFLFFRKGCFLS